MVAGLQSYDVILIIASMILVGLFIGRIVEKLSIPNISGYLMVGIVFGIILTFFKYDGLLEIFMYLTKFGLGFIALSIGLELDIRKIWKRRNEVLIVTLSQAILVFVFTSVGLFLFGMDLHIALLLDQLQSQLNQVPFYF